MRKQGVRRPVSSSVAEPPSISIVPDAVPSVGSSLRQPGLVERRSSHCASNRNKTSSTRLARRRM